MLDSEQHWFFFLTQLEKVLIFRSTDKQQTDNSFLLRRPLLPQPLNTSSLESAAALAASWSTPNLWPLTPHHPTPLPAAGLSAQSTRRGACCHDDGQGPQRAQVNKDYRCHSASVAASSGSQKLVDVCHTATLCLCVFALRVLVPSVLMLPD